MTAILLDGKEIAKKIRTDLKTRVAEMKDQPGLAAIIVGDNPASKIYVDIKRKTCEEVGIYSELHALDRNTSEDDLFELIHRLNTEPRIHGILLQLPIPDHLDEERVFEQISFRKDVDGFHETNMGRLVRGAEGIVPCTPKGVITLLEAYGIDVSGKHVVVVGRSNIVGRPVALMFLNRDATVSIAHRKTADLSALTNQADILVSAAGKPGIIRSDMIKEGAIVVDVGINKVEGKIVGDVDFEKVKEIASYITPVPGGIGPMTVAMLLENTVRLAR